MTTVNASKASKRILSVTIKRMVDDSPDTSWLGEYSNRPTSEFSIDRAHSEDCPVNRKPTEAIEKLERIISHIDAQTEEGTSATDVLCELQQELAECDCGEHGDMERNQYRYFNPSFNYVDKSGHALPENTREEVREYVHQDYERMESLNRGNWCFISICTECEVQLTPFGTIQRITSGGLWEIESDSDESYLESVEKEELSDLRTQLKALGFSSRAISTAFKSVERKDS